MNMDADKLAAIVKLLERQLISFSLRVLIDPRERNKEDVDKFKLSKVYQRVNHPFLCPRPDWKCVNSFFLCFCLEVRIIIVSLQKVITITVITNTISRYEVLR